MVIEQQGCQPFVTIGVTTYNRKELLRKTLDSILAQSFTDFEVIVGNDYIEELLTGEMIGISDPRIRFVNHPQNLQEVGNMNALLEMADGRYFTWLYDDDLYAPDFLQTAYDSLTKAAYPQAYFCSYIIFPDDQPIPEPIGRGGRLFEFSGVQFLDWYSVFKLKLFPTYGLFDTEVLQTRVGGFESLCDSPMALYSEYLFLAKCSMFDRILFVDDPLYLYRFHEGSFSETNTELELYQTAGENLVRRSSEVLQAPELIANYSANFLKICCLHLIEFAHKQGSHLYFVSTQEKQGFGVKAACRILAGHWCEASRIKRLYKHLGGTFGLHNQIFFFKVVLFCSYLMISHFFHFSRANSKRDQAKENDQPGLG
ncbi:MAG: glycosyltransferase family 2 protein [Desulfuromusa sp.]|nr:glycosyltransferase family 2 protein [Desulfuromusa sp.]